MDKADGCAGYALPYVSRISERAAHVYVTLRICHEKKKEKEHICMCVCVYERGRERKRERETAERTLLDSEHSRSY